MTTPLDTSPLRIAVPPKVRRLCQTLADAGHRSWVVGGVVRDLLLAQLRGESEPAVPGDWDLATDARPEHVVQLFRRVVPTGIQHGTVTVMLGKDGFEVTTLRGETTYSDGRHPDQVYYVDDIAEDLSRRDFTINAIAYDPLSDVLIDPHGGQRDLAEGVLRAVGNAEERFSEDGLRALRAARFVATLEMDLDPATERAIGPSLSSYAKVSAERIRDEWVKALMARAPSRAFEVMRRTGLLAVSAPELIELHGIEQNRFHAHDVWQHTMECLDHCPARPMVRLAGLLHDIGKPETRAFSEKTNDHTFYDHEQRGAELADALLRRLRFSNTERAHVVHLVRHHLVVYDESWTDAAVRRWLRRVTPELAEDVLALSRADILAKGRDPTDELARVDALRERLDAVIAEGTALTVRDLAINGNDLHHELGIEPGPVMGTVLRALLDEVTDQPQINERAVLLARARDLLACRDG